LYSYTHILFKKVNLLIKNWKFLSFYSLNIQASYIFKVTKEVGKSAWQKVLWRVPLLIAGNSIKCRAA